MLAELSANLLLVDLSLDADGTVLSAHVLLRYETQRLRDNVLESIELVIVIVVGFIATVVHVPVRRGPRVAVLPGDGGHGHQVARVDEGVGVVDDRQLEGLVPGTAMVGGHGRGLGRAEVARRLLDRQPLPVVLTSHR